MGDSEPSKKYVMSKDGTRIGFLCHGIGPGIVLVQGAMATAYNFDQLAQFLAHNFTVYTPDRRGRGLSPKPYDSKHNIARDVEDVEAILTETGANQIFGLSSGAMITLEAARTLPQVTRASVYEPPFYRDGISHHGIQQLNAEIAQGDMAAALVTSLRVAKTAPKVIQILPNPFARLLARFVLYIDDRKTVTYAKLRDLIPGIRYDFNVVGGMDGKMETLASITKPMLLLSGTKSPAFLQQSIRSLKGILPQAHHIEFDGLGHSGSWNASRGGCPRVVAKALLEFFV